MATLSIVASLKSKSSEFSRVDLAGVEWRGDLIVCLKSFTSLVAARILAAGLEGEGTSSIAFDESCGGKCMWGADVGFSSLLLVIASLLPRKDFSGECFVRKAYILLTSRARSFSCKKTSSGKRTKRKVQDTMIHHMLSELIAIS